MTKLVDVIVKAIQDKKGKNISFIDLSAHDGAICPTFVICNADSTTQVGAIIDNVEAEVINQLKEKPLRLQGKDNSIWIVIDYGDVMVHVFQTEARQFYALDELWYDAPVVKYKDEE